MYVRILALFVAAGLLLSGCDSSGSNANEWEGDWEVLQVNNESVPEDVDLYVSYSTDALTIIASEENQSGCTIRREEVVEVDGNKVTVKQANGGLRTERLSVSGGELTGRVIRANNADQEGGSFRARSVEENPRELAGSDCTKAGASETGGLLYSVE